MNPSWMHIRLLKLNCFYCDRSARALFGLLCVPACERAAGKHLGWTWNRRSEVHLFPLCPRLFNLSPLGGSVAFCQLTLLSLFCMDTKLAMLHFPLREYVVDLEEGSQHLMRYRTIAPLVSSGAVQLIWMWKWVNSDFERGNCVAKRCPHTLWNNRSANSSLQILHNAPLCGDIWIYF